MTLSDLDLSHGTRFNVFCRVRRPLRRLASNGSNYLCFTIEDCSRSLKAYAWEKQCDLSMAIHDLDRVGVVGKMREFNGEVLAIVSTIQPLVHTESLLELLPRIDKQKGRIIDPALFYFLLNPVLS